jgi:hypothetical protein
MSSTILRATPPISSTAFHAVDVACSIYWRNWKTSADKVWWASTNSRHSQWSTQPVGRHFNTDNHSVSDMDSNDSRKIHKILISKLRTVHPYGINKRFSYASLYLNFPFEADIDRTFNSYLIFHTCFIIIIYFIVFAVFSVLLYTWQNYCNLIG